MADQKPHDLSSDERARQADKIVRDPKKYKVCLGCDSIVVEKVSICPNCHGYRFDSDQEAVVSKLAGAR
ncbi:MAG: hypothetical protein R3F11_25880 [Verrucomicrobiales bacterium]